MIMSVAGCFLLVLIFSCHKTKISACHTCTTAVYVINPNGSASWQTSLDTTFCNNDSLYNLLKTPVNGMYIRHSCN